MHAQIDPRFIAAFHEKSQPILRYLKLKRIKKKREAHQTISRLSSGK